MKEFITEWLPDRCWLYSAVFICSPWSAKAVIICYYLITAVRLSPSPSLQPRSGLPQALMWNTLMTRVHSWNTTAKYNIDRTQNIIRCICLNITPPPSPPPPLYTRDRIDELIWKNVTHIPFSFSSIRFDMAALCAVQCRVTRPCLNRWAALRVRNTNPIKSV